MKNETIVITTIVAILIFTVVYFTFYRKKNNTDSKDDVGRELLKRSISTPTRVKLINHDGNENTFTVYSKKIGDDIMFVYNDDNGYNMHTIRRKNGDKVYNYQGGYQTFRKVIKHTPKGQFVMVKGSRKYDGKDFVAFVAKTQKLDDNTYLLKKMALNPNTNQWEFYRDSYYYF